MDWLGTLELDAVLHQPVRTRIAAYLAARGEATFTELKRALDATDGNLERHLKKMVEAGYVKVAKKSGELRLQTIYRLTAAGERTFHGYVDALQHLLKFDQ
jgi:DNA-binding MarR family transcriptional regulator